jgi:TP901 family phage tail tape measure protein
MGKNVVNMGKNAQWTGRQMMVGITAPIMAIGAVSVKSAIDISKLDLQLKKVLGNVDTQGIKDLDNQTRKLSETYGITRTELKAIQTEFARVGFAISTIQEATRQTAELTMVGDVDTTDAQELIRVLYQTGMGYKEVQDQLNKLNVIDDQTNMSLKEVIGTLKDVYPTARRFGDSASEIAALMTGITEGGLKAGEAATEG